MPDLAGVDAEEILRVISPALRTLIDANDDQ
jgi:hypothetical protein